MQSTSLIRRGGGRAWQRSLTVDSLLHYSLLGSCYGSLLACLATVVVVATGVIPRELHFPLIRTTLEESVSTQAAPVGKIIMVFADGSLVFDGRDMGGPSD